MSSRQSVGTLCLYGWVVDEKCSNMLSLNVTLAMKAMKSVQLCTSPARFTWWEVFTFLSHYVFERELAAKNSSIFHYKPWSHPSSITSQPASLRHQRDIRLLLKASDCGASYSQLPTANLFDSVILFSIYFLLSVFYWTVSFFSLFYFVNTYFYVQFIYYVVLKYVCMYVIWCLYNIWSSSYNEMSKERYSDT